MGLLVAGRSTETAGPSHTTMRRGGTGPLAADRGTETAFRQWHENRSDWACSHRHKDRSKWAFSHSQKGRIDWALSHRVEDRSDWAFCYRNLTAY